jgi:hypothetical protein
MNAIRLKWTSQTIGWLRTDFVCETFGDAVLLGICGFLYGFVFMGMGEQVRHEFGGWAVFWFAGRCGLGSCILGALIGLPRRMFWKS